MNSKMSAINDVPNSSNDCGQKDSDIRITEGQTLTDDLVSPISQFQYDCSSKTPLDMQIGHTIEVFRSKFNSCPTVIAGAPGRINLIGEHTDYQKGFVFPMAIDKYVLVALGPAPAGNYQIYSEALDELKQWGGEDNPALPAEPPLQSEWWCYALGVVRCFYKSLKNAAVGCTSVPTIASSGFRIAVTTAVPIGAGLSSSAAFEMATATALEVYTGNRVPPWAPGDNPNVISSEYRKVQMCQKAEHLWARVPCGIMDQCISCFGKAGYAILLDCRNGHKEYSLIDESKIGILVFNSGVKHRLVDGQYRQRKLDCEDAISFINTSLDDAKKVATLRDVSMELLESCKSKMPPRPYHRALHVVAENARCREFFDLANRGDYKEAGAILYAGHDSLKTLYEVTIEQADLIVDIAKKIPGVYGARMTGAGFGGSVIVLAQRSHIDEVRKQLMDEYMVAYQKSAQAKELACQSAIVYEQPQAFKVRPVSGAFNVVF